MCVHYWLLGMTTPEGTPATCKLCNEERWFRARDCFGTDYRVRPHIVPSQVRQDEMPLSPRGARL